MDNDGGAIDEMEPQRVFADHLLINRLIFGRKIGLGPLQRIVNVLGAAEEIWRALDKPPASLDAELVHKHRERRQYFRYPAAIEGGANVDNVAAGQ